MPLTSSVEGQMMARFRNFDELTNSHDLVKRHSAFRTGPMIYLSEKSTFGLGAL